MIFWPNPCIYFVLVTRSTLWICDFSVRLFPWQATCTVRGTPKSRRGQQNVFNYNDQTYLNWFKLLLLGWVSVWGEDQRMCSRCFYRCGCTVSSRGDGTKTHYDSHQQLSTVTSRHKNTDLQHFFFNKTFTLVGHFSSMSTVKSCFEVLLPRGSSWEGRVTWLMMIIKIFVIVCCMKFLFLCWYA